MALKVRGKHFEELPVGTEIDTPARTVTEADVVNFACFSGDYNPLHTDREFAAKTAFGERIAHGLVSLAFVTGLMDKVGFIDGTAIAFLGVEWKFKRAVKFDDTISAHFKVVEARLTSKPGAGVVKFAVTATNQKGEEVSGGFFDMMMSTRKSA